MQTINNPNEIVKEVFSLYEKFGNADYIGEPVSQLEHMSQAAALAEAEGCDDEVILAAFFHDIGHLCDDEGEAESMDGMGNVDHEILGSNYLRKMGFSERVSALVESHVVAKRYLTYKYPDYYTNLSEASKITLEFQGGRMNPDEALSFEQHPDFELYVSLRRFDDKAKEMDKPVDNLEKIKQISLQHLNRNI